MTALFKFSLKEETNKVIFFPSRPSKVKHALRLLVLLLSRIPPFFSGILLAVVAGYAWRKGFFDKFR